MIDKKNLNKSLFGIYEVTFKNTLTSKEWIYNWFIIKNFFREFNFHLYNINENYPEYLNIVNHHSGYLINKDINIKDNNSLKKFYGEFTYFRKNKNININKKLINYFEKYTKTNNIELKNIKVKNNQIKQFNILKESSALGFYNIQLNTSIHPTEWTYHWFIIKNMFIKLNYEIEELNDNYPEYRYITGEKEIFTLNTFKNPKIRKENYLDTFEGFCRVYNNKKINISKKNPEKYEALRDKKIHKLESFFIKYFQLNNINIKTINITQDKIYYY